MPDLPIRSLYWRSRYVRWGHRQDGEPGYAVLVPVPGDLPVFLDIALSVLARQSARHRVEVLVTPDMDTEAFRTAFERQQRQWTSGPMRVVLAPLAERILLPRLNDPGRYHPTQLIAGIRATRASHVVFHDADLVPTVDDMHDQLYETAAAQDLDVCGVDPAWDAWYAEHGLGLVATWEMCARVDWLRSFPPHRHFGQESTFRGERHVFDTTFWPQCHTSGDRLRVIDGLAYTHFNYVISTYRHYQAAPDGFHDAQFRLLLIRLFADLFDASGADYAVPAVEVLAAGLGAAGDRRVAVRYEAADVAAYQRFRAQFVQIIDAPWVSAVIRTQALTALEPFDDWAAIADRTQSVATT